MLNTSKNIWDFDPRSVPGCSAWFDASDSSTITLSSGNVTQWRDKSGNARHLNPLLTFSNATVSTAYKNRLNVLNFSGTGIYNTSAGAAPYPIDAYFVLSLKDITTRVDVFATGPNQNDFNSLTFAEYTANRWHNGSANFSRTPNCVSPSNESSSDFLIIQWSLANSNFLIRRNGSLLVQTSTYTYTNSGSAVLQIGTRTPVPTGGFTPDAPFRGYMGEIVIFNRQLGDTERQQIEGYLSWKWGLLRPFYTPINPLTVSGCVLWLDASDTSTLTLSGSNITAWRDKSTLSNHVTQISTTPPTYFSHDSSVNFTATSSTFLRGALPASYSNASVFIVASILSNPSPAFPRISVLSASANANSTVVGQLLVANANTEAVSVYLSTNTNPQGQGVNLVTYVSNVLLNTKVLITNASTISGSSYTVLTRLNGNTQTTSSTSGTYSFNSQYPGTYNKYTLGNYADASAGTGDAYEGKIFEYMIFSNSLTATQRQTIEEYLMRKWNVPPSVIPESHPFFSIKPFLRQFNPIDIDGCSLWLDALDRSSITLSGTDVTQWNDKSGNGRNLTQSTAGLRPTYSATSKAIVFDGTRYLDIPNALAAITPTYTIFAVEKRASDQARFFLGNRQAVANTGLILGYNSSTTSHHTTAHIVDLQVTIPSYLGTSEPVRITRYAYTGTTRSTFINGGQLSNSQSFSATLTTWPTANIGAGYNTNSVNWYIGNIHEIIFYNTSLTTEQSQRVEGYLAWKWGISLDYRTTTPLSIPGCTMWLDGADPAGTGIPPSAGTLSTWVDKSGNGRNGVQYSTFARPQFVTNSLNSKGGVSFTAASSNCYQTQSVLPTPGTIFIVGFSSNDGMVLSGIPTPNSGHPPYYASFARDVEYGVNNTSDAAHSVNLASTSNVNYILTGLYTGSNVTAMMNDGTLVNTVAFSGTPKTPATTLIGINSYAGSLHATFGGTINEFITYSVVLNGDQRQAIQRYLSHKWGIAIPTIIPTTHPFYRFSSSSILPFSPLNISDCRLWLDGTDPNGTGVIPANDAVINRWIDKSFSRNTCSNSVASNSPIFKRNILNGLNVLSFTGPGVFQTTTSQWLDNTTMTFPNVSNTIFAVVYNSNSTTKSSTGNNYIISARTDALLSYSSYTSNLFTVGIGNGTSWSNIATNTPSRDMNGVWSLTGMTMASNVVTPYFNGTAQDTKTATMSSTTGFIIGEAMSGFRGQCWNGYIAEIIIYSGVLSAIQRQDVEGYLAWKWGLMSLLPNTHPYRRFRPSNTISIVDSASPPVLYLWLDASDLTTLFQNSNFTSQVTASGQTVRAWTDKSGNLRHYTGSTGPTYTTATAGSKQTVLYSVNGQSLVGQNLPAGSRGLDFFVVTQPSTSTADWRTLFRGASTDHHVLIQQGTYNLGAYYNQSIGFSQFGSLTLNGSARVLLHLSISSSGVHSASLNGNLTMSVASGTSGNDSIYYLGSIGSQLWGGISEVRVYTTNLTNAQKSTIFSELNTKWTIY